MFADLKDLEYNWGGQIVNLTNWNNFENEVEFCCHKTTGMNWACPKQTRIYCHPTCDWLTVTCLLQLKNTGCQLALSLPLALDLELLLPSPVLPERLLLCPLCASLAVIQSLSGGWGRCIWLAEPRSQCHASCKGDGERIWPFQFATRPPSQAGFCLLLWSVKRGIPQT